MMKNILVINGSASKNSSNQRLIEKFVELTKDSFKVTVFNSLKEMPHFDPDLSVSNTPKIVAAFRRMVEEADGIVICTPEYIFSIPSGLKNAIEWSVATTIFTDKPVGMIAASASGVKALQELELIMKTVQAKFNSETTLLIQGIKGKIDQEGILTDAATEKGLRLFSKAFIQLVQSMRNE